MDRFLDRVGRGTDLHSALNGADENRAHERRGSRIPISRPFAFIRSSPARAL